MSALRYLVAFLILPFLEGSIGYQKSPLKQNRTECLSSKKSFCVWQYENDGRKGSVSKTGDRSFSFNVIPGSRWTKESRTNFAERSEIRQLGSLPIAKEFAFGFNFYAENKPPSDSNWLVLGQIHHVNNENDVPASPPFAQYIYNGKEFEVRIRYSTLNPLSKQPSGVSLYKSKLDVTKLNSVLYCITYSSDANIGKVYGWINGKNIIKYRGSVGYASDTAPFAKLGIYRYPSLKTLKINYSNIILMDGCPYNTNSF